MKKIAYTLLIATSLFAVDITKSKEFTLEVESNQYKSSFSISHKATTANEIESLFEKAVTIAKKSNICSGGQYSIYPNYKYIKNQRVDDGYNSNINFECYFKESKEYEDTLSKLKYLNLKISQNRIEPTITKSESQITKLEKEAFKYAKEYKKVLESDFGKCEIESINLNQTDKNYNPIKPNLLRSSISKTTISTPIDKSLTINLRVDYKFRCKNDSN
jgi:uncharacterized protein YggE